MARQISAFASEDAASNFLRTIHSDEVFPLAREAGLKIEDFAGVTGERNELFRSSIAEAIPGVRASSRAFHTYLNGMRFSTFQSYALSHPAATSEDLKGVARAINFFSGVGKLPYENTKIVRGLSEALYAPRLTASYVQSLASPFMGTAAARKFAARHVVQFVATGLALGGMAKATKKYTGVDFELDPRGTDFGKFSVGQYRIGIFGGFTALAKYTAQALTGQRKTSAGNVQNISRLGPLETFGRSRLHPSVGFLIDLKTGKTLDGRELYNSDGTLKKGAVLRDGVMPLSAGDIWDAVQADRVAGGSGLKGGLISAPALFGADVQTRGPARGSSPLTDRQKQFIYDLADGLGNLNEDEEASRILGRTVRVADLNSREASKVIDELKKRPEPER
jgi:hypothetical protein